jgi:hypothetical protein
MAKHTIPSHYDTKMTLVQKIIWLLSAKDYKTNELVDIVSNNDKLKTLEARFVRAKSIACTLTQLKNKGLVTKTKIDGKTAIYSLNLNHFN